MKCCTRRRFLILSTLFNIACMIVVIGFLLLYYIVLPHKYQAIVKEMSSCFREMKFPVRMHPMSANKDVVIFGSDGDLKDASFAMMILLGNHNYLLYYNGRDYICFCEDNAKFGWRIDLNDSEPFGIIDTATSKFIYERSVQYKATDGGDEP